MRFIKDYFSDDTLRQELNELTRRTFHFDFEEWYHNHYIGGYIPYSYEEEGRLLSNASANIMKFMHHGKLKTYIQIGTVMTAKDCRNKGYARELITKIIEDYQGQVDGIYLFANLKALEFYKNIGFQEGLQYRYTLKQNVHIHKSDKLFEKVNCIDTDIRHHYMNTVREADVNAEFDQMNRYGLQMFYTANLEQVYYTKELDCFICFEMDDNVLYLNSIIGKSPVSLKAVLERIPVDYQKLVLGFTPCLDDQELFDAEVYDGEADYRFFYIGDDLQSIEKDKLYFPEYSHA